MQNIIIFGKNGQVATDLLQIFSKKYNFHIHNFASKDIDFSKIDILKQKFAKLPKADFIINTTSYNYVDNAEDNSELADNINHKAVKILAQYCQNNNIRLIHYSTNYVFDGSKKEAYSEDDIQSLKPVNIYGMSKLNGEKAIIKSGCQYLILRLATVFSAKNNNFVGKIIKLTQNRSELKIIHDQITNPTSSYDIAKITIKIIEKISQSNNFQNNIYHLASMKQASYFEFAYKIANYMQEFNLIKKINIIPVTSSEFTTKAQRPLNGALNCNKIEKELKITLPDWDSALKNIIKDLCATDLSK